MKTVLIPIICVILLILFNILMSGCGQKTQGMNFSKPDTAYTPMLLDSVQMDWQAKSQM